MMNPTGRKRIVYDDLPYEESTKTHQSWSSPGKSPINKKPFALMGEKSFNIFGESDARALAAEVTDFESLMDGSVPDEVGARATALTSGNKKRKRPSGEAIAQAHKRANGSAGNTIPSSPHGVENQVNGSNARATSAASKKSTLDTPSASRSSTKTAKSSGKVESSPAPANTSMINSKGQVLSAAAAALLPPGTEAGMLVVQESSEMEDDEDVDEMDLFQVETTEHLRQHEEEEEGKTTREDEGTGEKHLRTQDWKKYDQNEWDDQFEELPAKAGPNVEPQKEGDSTSQNKRGSKSKHPVNGEGDAEEGQFEEELQDEQDQEGDPDYEEEVQAGYEDGEYVEGEGEEVEEEEEEDDFDASGITWGDLSMGASSNAKGKGRALTHAEIWDDSALVDAWEAALEEYEVYHSRRAAAVAAKKGQTKQSALWNEAAEAGSSLAKEVEVEATSANKALLAAQKAQAKERKADAGKATSTDVGKQRNPSDPTSDMPNWIPLQNLEGAAATSLPGAESAGRDEMLQNVIMAWYWAGYYTAMYSGAACSSTSFPPPGPPPT